VLLLKIYETRQKHYSYYKLVKGKRRRREKRTKDKFNVANNEYNNEYNG